MSRPTISGYDIHSTSKPVFSRIVSLGDNKQKGYIYTHM